MTVGAPGAGHCGIRTPASHVPHRSRIPSRGRTCEVVGAFPDPKESIGMALAVSLLSGQGLFSLAAGQEQPVHRRGKMSESSEARPVCSRCRAHRSRRNRGGGVPRIVDGLGVEARDPADDRRVSAPASSADFHGTRASRASRRVAETSRMTVSILNWSQSSIASGSMKSRSNRMNPVIRFARW